jgi:hypothetical protein
MQWQNLESDTRQRAQALISRFAQLVFRVYIEEGPGSGGAIVNEQHVASLVFVTPKEGTEDELKRW